MAHKIEDALNDCLKRMFEGESIESCLKTYPKQAPELEPLLKTSSVLMQKSTAIQPDSEFKARTHLKLQRMFYAEHERLERKTAIPIWRRQWAIATTSILAILFAGAGTIAASVNALPDQPLYSVKLATEQVRVTMASSDMDKAKLHIQFAEHRALEIAELARQGKTEQIPTVTEQFASHLDKMPVAEKTETVKTRDPKVLAPPQTAAPSPALAPSHSLPASAGGEAPSEDGRESRGELEIMLSDSCITSLNMLQTALAETPKEARPALEQAIHAIENNYDEAITNLGA